MKYSRWPAKSFSSQITLQRRAGNLKGGIEASTSLKFPGATEKFDSAYLVQFFWLHLPIFTMSYTNATSNGYERANG